MNALKQKQKSKSSNNKTKPYIRKQRACGAVLLIIAILTTVISQDSTAAVMLIPIALYIMITKKHVMCF